jgi:hypothetical protein
MDRLLAGMTLALSLLRDKQLGKEVILLQESILENGTS